MKTLHRVGSPSELRSVLDAVLGGPTDAMFPPNVVVCRVGASQHPVDCNTSDCAPSGCTKATLLITQYVPKHLQIFLTKFVVAAQTHNFEALRMNLVRRARPKAKMTELSQQSHYWK
jgi:hypothetical protein